MGRAVKAASTGAKPEPEARRRAPCLNRKGECGTRQAVGGGGAAVQWAPFPAPHSLCQLILHNVETVNVRPETAAFDAVFGRSLTAGGLGVTYTKAHGQSSLLPPVPHVSYT